MSGIRCIFTLPDRVMKCAERFGYLAPTATESPQVAKFSNIRADVATRMSRGLGVEGGSKWN